LAIALLGGNLNNGANNGPFFANLNNGVSASSWNFGAFGLLIVKRSAYSLPLGKNND
jgi:hypothetical protein